MKTKPVLTIPGPAHKAIVDTRKMAARALLATGKRDREGDMIDIGGVSLEHHRINPVAMLDHGKVHPLPIGRCCNGEGVYLVERDPQMNALWQTTHFSQKSLMAEQTFALIAEDILRGNSVGLRPIEVSELDADHDRGHRRNPKTGSAGKHVHRSELVEVSWCAVPVNPDAAFSAIEKSWCGRSLHEGITQAIRPYLPQRNAWSTGWTADSEDGDTFTLEEVETLEALADAVEG